ncbi:hypothetical protein ACV3V0_15290 [Clostridium perfringens]
MVFEYLPLGTFENNFMNYQKCEGRWIDISEEKVKMFLESSLTTSRQCGVDREYLDWSQAEKILKSGKVIKVITGDIRLVTKYNKCPICGSSITDFPAISRRDNSTEICADCGNKEAIEEYIDFRL